MFRLSTHAVEKHLRSRNSDASLFFSKESMLFCIQQCLTVPDRTCMKSNKLILEKEISEDIGLLGYAQPYTRKFSKVFIDLNYIENFGGHGNK